MLHISYVHTLFYFELYIIPHYHLFYVLNCMSFIVHTYTILELDVIQLRSKIHVLQSFKASVLLG